MGRPAKAIKIQETPFRNRGQGSPVEEKSKQMVHYKIIEICGSSVKARRTSDGRIICRDASKFKLLRESSGQNWREKLLCLPDRTQLRNTNSADSQLMSNSISPLEDSIE